MWNWDTYCKNHNQLVALGTSVPISLQITMFKRLFSIREVNSRVGHYETSRRSIDSSNLVTKLRTPTKDQSLPPASASVAGSVASPVVQTQEAAG